LLSQAIIRLLEPFQERRRKIAADRDYIIEVLHQGGIKARENAQKTISEVREKMGIRQF
jgi:tryptophanyl-tRNA synthetase